MIFFGHFFFHNWILSLNINVNKNVFLTIVLGSQWDHNFIQVVSQILFILQFEITQKKLHLENFTIAKPLFYLELRGKTLRLPAKLCQM